jgi:hypothetical protein
MPRHGVAPFRPVRLQPSWRGHLSYPNLLPTAWMSALQGGFFALSAEHLRSSRSGSHRLSPPNPGRTLYNFMSMSIAQALLLASTLCAKHQIKWFRAPVEYASFPLSPLSRRTTRMKRVTRDTSGLTYIRRIEKIEQAYWTRSKHEALREMTDPERGTLAIVNQVISP